MAFTRKALRASAEARKGNNGCLVRKLLMEGEDAYRNNTPCPYDADTEEYEVWLEGWQDAHVNTKHQTLNPDES